MQSGHHVRASERANPVRAASVAPDLGAKHLKSLYVFLGCGLDRRLPAAVAQLSHRTKICAKCLFCAAIWPSAIVGGLLRGHDIA